MNFFLRHSTTILCCVLLLSCSKHEHSADGGDVPADEGFESSPQLTSLSGSEIREASGIADSKANAGSLWVEQDSGNPPDLILLGHDGQIGNTIHIQGATNRDWEDIQLAPGPESGKNYLYIGDIGDNNLDHNLYSFYRFEEPAATVTAVTNYDLINFRYPDVSHDAEAFLVDPTSKDIYIITKRDDSSLIYRLQYPQSLVDDNVAELVGELPYNTVVSAALSSDGREILVKTYTEMSYYKREEGKSIPEALQGVPKKLDYAVEAQGEAICFAADNSGFYTLPEEALGIAPRLSFYQRK